MSSSQAENVPYQPYQPPLVYIQNACLLHKPVHVGEPEGPKIVERPERLQFVNAGIAALYARLEEKNAAACSVPGTSRNTALTPPIRIVRSTAKIESLTENKATKYVLHIKDDDNPGDPTYAEQLERLCQESLARISAGGREIPDNWEQDLYLCPDTLDAIKGALGTVCQAVDAVAAATRPLRSVIQLKQEEAEGRDTLGCTRAFAAIRPPGELCAAGTPAGRGLVNNIAVAAIHAFEEHSFTHIVIFDIDLYYGRGTHRITKEINSQTSAASSRDSNVKLPRVFYGGLHDISVYPCKDDHTLKTEANSAGRGLLDDWFANCAFFDDEVDVDFDTRYLAYQNVIWEAQDFLCDTGARSEDVIVLMSCGFTASEHESTDLRRENYCVPTDFYRRFTADACDFADNFAQGRIVSILSGGYSERALVSGTMAHLAGMIEADHIDTRWWNPENLLDMEKSAQTEDAPQWARRARQISDCLEEEYDPSGPSTIFIPPQYTPPTSSPSSCQLQGQPINSASTPSQWAAQRSPEPVEAALVPETRGRGRGRGRTRATKTPAASVRRGSRRSAARNDSIGEPESQLEEQGVPQGAQPVAGPSQKRRAPNTSNRPQPKRARQSTSTAEPPPSQQPVSDVPASSLSRNAPDTPATGTSDLSQPAPTPTNAATTRTQDRVRTTYAELQASLNSFVGLVNQHLAQLPHDLMLAVRPVRGCVWRLESSLNQADVACKVLDSLNGLAKEVHDVCNRLEECTLANEVKRTWYGFEGAVLELKETVECLRPPATHQNCPI